VIEQARGGIHHRHRLRRQGAADGYTLVMVSSTHVISPWLYKHLPYDPIKSFAVVGKLVESPYVLLVHPKVQAKQRAGVRRAGEASPTHPLRVVRQRQRAAPDGRAVRRA
jgi:tripartite-type tricarboxylate transporter receptor subunit TctC